MRYALHAVVAAIIAVAATIPVMPAYADELFIPDQMLFTQPDAYYYGVYIRDDGHATTETVRLASSSDIIGIPAEVTIPAGRNHGTFEIKIRGTGDLEVRAERAGEFTAPAFSTIHERAGSDTAIVLTVPEASASREFTAAVQLVDHLGTPVRSAGDTRVHLAGTGVDMPNTVTIRDGETHAMAPIKLHADDATITAYTDRTVSDTAEIRYVHDRHSVRVAVAPDGAIASNSYAYVFVWLEDAAGRQQQVTSSALREAELTISDRLIAGFTPTRTADHSTTKVNIVNGLGMAKLYTHGEGTASVTASVRGIGAAEAEMEVLDRIDGKDVKVCITTLHIELQLVAVNSTAAAGDDDGGAETVLEPVTVTETDCRPLERISQVLAARPNTMTAAVYPPSIPLDSAAYLVASAYTDTSLWDIDTDAENPDHEVIDVEFRDKYDRTLPDVIPTYGIEGSVIHVSSSGLEHEESITWDPEGLPAQSVAFRVMPTSQAPSAIHLSSPHTGSATAEIAVGTERYTLELRQMSVDAGGDSHGTQPVLAVMVLDSAGNVVDPHDTFGDLRITLISSQADLPQTVRLEHPITYVYGTPHVRNPEVTAIADTEDITGQQSNIPASPFQLTIRAPDSVRWGEEFPAYAYLRSADGHILDISEHMETGCTAAAQSRNMYSCMPQSSERETFAIFGETVGFGETSVAVFTNNLPSDLATVAFGSDTIDIGTSQVVGIAAPDAATHIIDTELPYTESDAGIVITPVSPGTYDIHITLEAPGYEAATFSHEYTIPDRAVLRLESRAVDTGTLIATTGTAVITSESGETATAGIPGETAVGLGTAHVEVPRDVIVGNAGYSFVRATDGDGNTWETPTFPVNVDGLTVVRLEYMHTIRIQVHGGTGGGIYEDGQMVTLDAPPRERIPFLVSDVFDRWTELPQGHGSDIYSQTVQLRARENFSTEALYREDYTGLILVCGFAGIAALSYVNRVRILAAIGEYREKDT